MSAPADPHLSSPIPPLPPGTTPAEICDGLAPREREQFERAYRDALARAAESLDLGEVLDVLRNYHRIAQLTARQGREAHQRMLDRAAAILEAGGNPDGVPVEEVRDRIRARFGA